ncbi:hypothetical protein EJ08DRAFT_694549 [Tothia fuscella]|uniref:Uncharacterized protein n=1 Tax=Tothia fuscella TaxID=1048955 RepID=A0A9P4NY83_9PEZI|nr:hypothetical protein EJ08DRAFT_694549 [Tothia fuscella]
MAAPQGQQNGGDTHQANGTTEFAQAFKEITRGEQTAAALENHLDALERKINDLLENAEKNHGDAKEKVESSKDDQTETSNKA